MPASFMTLFPNVLNGLEATKHAIQTSAALSETIIRSHSLGFALIKEANDLGHQLMKQFLPLTLPLNQRACYQLFEVCREGSEGLLSVLEKNMLGY